MKTDAAHQHDAGAPAIEDGAENGVYDDTTIVHPADPFAVDLFATRRPAVGSPETPNSSLLEEAFRGRDANSFLPPRRVAAAWHRDLPRLTVEETRRSQALARLSPSLARQVVEAITHTLARLTHAPSGEVSLSLLEAREAELTPDAESGAPEATPRTIVEVGIEPGEAALAITAPAEFAQRLVARALGGGEEKFDARRELSPVEEAYVEFLCLSVAQALNRAIGEPLWRLKRIADTPPPWLDGGGGGGGGVQESPRGYVTAVRVVVGAAGEEPTPTSGVVRCYLPAAALDALDATNNGLLFRPPDSRVEFARYKRIAPDVRTAVVIGETTLTAADLAGLDAGDIVLIERPAIAWRIDEGRVRIGDAARVRVGDGSELLLVGEMAGGERAVGGPRAPGRDGSEPVLALRFVGVEAGAAATERVKERVPVEEMKQDETAADSAPGTGVLEGLLLTVRVELGARRLTLDDLANLRAGQIIELGCRATDPVDLVTENGTVARGELVDVEGRLGVRITRVLV